MAQRWPEGLLFGTRNQGNFIERETRSLPRDREGACIGLTTTIEETSCKESLCDTFHR